MKKYATKKRIKLSTKKKFHQKLLPPYRQKYSYILAGTLIVLLFLLVVKVLSAFAYLDAASFQKLITGSPTKYSSVGQTIDGVPKNELNCADSIIDDTAAMRDRIINYLHSRFGVILTGDVGTSTDKPLQVYNTMCILSNYPAFFTNIGLPNHPLTIELHQGIGGINAGEGACLEGYTPNLGSQTNLTKVGWCPNPGGSNPNDVIANRFVMVHEMGHVMLDRGVTNVYNQYVNKWGSRIILPTFNCAKASKRGLSTPHECFADIVGEFLVYNVYKHDDTYNVSTGITFSDFGNQNSGYYQYYSFARNNIFGGSSDGSGGSFGAVNGGGGSIDIPVANSALKQPETTTGNNFFTAAKNILAGVFNFENLLSPAPAAPTPTPAPHYTCLDNPQARCVDESYFVKNQCGVGYQAVESGGATCGQDVTGANRICCVPKPAPPSPTPIPIPPDNCSVGSCMPKGMCIAANDLKLGAGTCGVSGNVCCQAIPAPISASAPVYSVQPAPAPVSCIWYDVIINGKCVDPCSTAKCGNGGYCWNSGAASHGCSGFIQGQNGALYSCAKGSNGMYTVSASRCQNSSCTINPSGSDYCTSGSVGGSSGGGTIKAN